MISREPTLERLAIAQGLLLSPFGLDESHLSRALAEIKAHQVDEADLYFQYTRSEGWSLEEGIVKTGSFSIDQGVGVRAVSGEKTAFAYSDDISEASRCWMRPALCERFRAQPYQDVREQLLKR
jgi:TldD protein